MASVQEHRTH